MYRSIHYANLTVLSALLLAASALAAPAAPGAAKTPDSVQTGSVACPAILRHSFNRLQDEAPQNLCQYAGKVVLVVNTASYCGFTSQYEGLEALYESHKAKGLVILGFPSNDFGQQEPGSNKEIADFCFNTYAVKFPMFSKTVVAGAGSNALFAALAKESGKAPQWNFYKYLIDRNGKVADSFNSLTDPKGTTLQAAINKLL